MNRNNDAGTRFRRHLDFPVLVVSQDYELFFQRSGSIEKCLIEPCDVLLKFAEKSGVRITFFVDAGMLCRMQELASAHPALGKDLSRVRQHIESLSAAGHEIGLHIHPHWEETGWRDGAWDFADTRYQLNEFSNDEVGDIVLRYTGALNELCDGSVRTYRAGGFCVEPFTRYGDLLKQAGITIDSSVVPGALLKDDDKGFDFSHAPDSGWWTFSDSPLNPCPNGQFLEIPITPQVLPFRHYWGRALDRALRRQPAAVLGDGVSKALGKREIARRLAGAGRTSELSMDAPKARQLNSMRTWRQHRDVWHVMGHPKLLGRPSLAALEEFILSKGIRRFESVWGMACAIRSSAI